MTGLRKTFQQLRLVTTGDNKEVDADNAFAEHLGQVGELCKYFISSYLCLFSSLRRNLGVLIEKLACIHQNGLNLQILRF